MNSFLQSRIARRLSASLLVFGILATLAAASVLVILDHHERMAEVEENFEIIKDSYLQSLASNVWVLNHHQIKAQLEGVLNLPNMEYLEVRSGSDLWSAGQVVSERVVQKTFPLTSLEDGRTSPLGELKAVAGLDGIYESIWKKALYTLATSFGVIFALSGFMFLLFHHYVTSRLFELSARISRLDPASSASSLDVRLSEDPNQLDELDMVAAAVVEMHRQIRTSTARLRENEESLQTTLDSLGDGVIAVDSDGNIFRMNPVAEQLTGWKLGEARTRPLTEVFNIVNAQSRRPAVNPVLQALEKGVVVGLANHTVLISRDGREYPIADSAAPIRDRNGRVSGVVLVFRDVSEEYKLQQVLRESEEKYRTLVEHAEEAIYVAQDGYIKFANPKTSRLAGYSMDELTSGPFTELIHPEDRALVFDRHTRRLRGEELPSQYEFRVVRKDGGIVWVDLKVVVIEWDHRPASLNFMNDLTEKKRAEQEKQALQAQLQHSQKMEAVGTLAGGVAHDFNNLLQAINGYAQLLLLDKTESDPEYSALTAIQNSGKRASDLVRSLLLFSRKAETERKPVNLNREVEHAGEILERTIPKMVEIELQLSGRLSPVMADPVQVEQVLLNLGTNAADAMPEGGKMLIRTAEIAVNEDSAHRALELKPGNYVQLTVSDSGQGMNRETVEKIYDPFFTTKELGKGTGLGLASVYGIVKGHDGAITCSSEPGQGSTFSIYFPVIESPFHDDLSPVEPGAVPRGSETILLVDDEEAIKGFAKEALLRFGYKVMTASTGEEALEIYSAQAARIDLVVMDLGMPGMGGLKCLQELLRLDPEVKVIIATGYSANGQVKKSLESGAGAYVAKPYQLSDLLNTIRQVFDDLG